MKKSKICIFFLLVSFVFLIFSCQSEISEDKIYYDVSFNSNGGSPINRQRIEKGKTAKKPTDPTRTDFSFDGWYDGNDLFNFSTPINADLVLKAKWAALVTTPDNGENSENEPPIQTDTTPPDEIRNISSNIGNGSVQLLWTNPSDNDFSNVEITFSPAVEEITQPIIIEGYPDSISCKLIEGLANGVDYTFTLVSVDYNNNKSHGETVTATPIKPADTTPPKEVYGFSVIRNHNRITLTWTNPSDDDFTSVEISAEPAEGNLAQPVIINATPSSKGNYLVSNLHNKTMYTFTIKTIDSSNNKSNGASTDATTRESTISLDVTLPNDKGDIILTNDKAPINVSFTSNDPITKFVWKKGDANDTPSAEMLLSDTTAESLSLVSPATLYVTENGVYDFAIQNEEGICKSKRVEVKTIDKTPLPEVTNLFASSDGTYINISWDTPRAENEYDSPLKNIVVSYIYNDNQFDEENGFTTLSATVNSNLNSFSLRIPSDKNENDYVKFYIQTVDRANNISNGIQEKTWCCYCIKVTDYYCDADEQIINLPNTVSLVKIIGLPRDFNNSCTKLRKKSYGKKIRIDLDLDGNCYSDLDFSFNTNLRKVTIPEGFKTIPKYAFSSCSNLTNIKIPTSITKIEDSAFSGCESLETIDIPCDLEEMNYLTFSGCTNLKSVHIKKIKSNEGLWSQNFYNCKSLETVTIDSVRLLGDKVFGHCESLKEISLPDNCELIMMEAFVGCTNLSKVTVGKYIDAIQYHAFYNCPSLTEIVFPYTNHKWFKTENRIDYSSTTATLNGTSIGYIFTNDTERNARILTQDYLDYGLYSDNYKPILKFAGN